jgi:hypothetical protein
MPPANPAAQSYDYQNGRGLDTFMSASIEEVSWETSLSSVYNTLAQAPIGSSALTSTAINYDASQVSGSVGGAITVGGSATATGGGTAGGSGGGNIVIDSINGVIRIYDSNGNEVGVIGNLSAA